LNQNQQENHYNQARTSLRQALSWYGNLQRHGTYLPSLELRGAIRSDLQQLQNSLEKLDQKLIKIATFGLVSRGKSAVVNGLLGQKILETGPLHGVTQWPKSVRWLAENGKISIELIDTPGLDEIEGEARAKMAQQVAQQADFILFIVAGDITRKEYEALSDLRQNHKPIILVFNKIDLYPDTDRLTIYQQLQQLGLGKQPLLNPDDIVMVAAEPAPVQVRVEWPDGRITQEWETPPLQIDSLKRKILELLNREGRSILALNALLVATETEQNIAKKTIELRQKEAEDLIWKYAKYKAIAVGVNPFVILDLIGGIITDLSLIRALSRLYGLPITSYEAGKLWRKILFSSGSLLLTEIVSIVMLGLGKSGAAITGTLENPSTFTAYSATALLQGTIAGYGLYIVGKVAQEYLKLGCSWGTLGPSRVIEDILNQVEPNTIIYRLGEELKEKLN
jgi:uncharacterized protein